MTSLIDPRFRVEVLASTPKPQSLVWRAMHQDYSENFVYDETPPPESEAGLLVVKHLLNGDRGHYGPLEHPQISFNVGWFPHDVMQQARTHRVGVSFDVQSGRYTGQRICAVATGVLDIDEVFYRRPVGVYRNRQGKVYQYTEAARAADLDIYLTLAKLYKADIDRGVAEEHARRVIPYALRQHFVVSCNLRSLLHLFDLRAKHDAQHEIVQMCELIWPHLEVWAPEVARWYSRTRLHKARLAP
jgi:thymidylate synthase (FAD)